MNIRSIKYFSLVILAILCSSIVGTAQSLQQIPRPLSSWSDTTQTNSDTLASIPPAIPDSSIAKVDTLPKKAAVSKSSELPLAGTLQQTRPDITWSLSAAKVIWAIIVFIIGYVVIRYFTKLLGTFAEKQTQLRLSIKAIIPVIRIFGWTILIYFIVARVFAPPIETLLALTASAGIAIGFASQDILKNIFGGVIILFDRPFQVGDKIAVGNYYGEVIHIGLRTVRIVTPDDSTVSIPNGDVVNQAVSNANSGESNCQVAAEFYLPADIDLDEVKKIAIRTAMTSRYIFLNKPIAIVTKNEIHEGRSLLKLRLKAYVFDIRYEFALISDLTEIVVAELLKRGLVKLEDLAFIQKT